MPNDCQNKLIIKGTKEQLQQFLDTYVSTIDTEQYLDFNKIIPEPLTPEECDPKCVIAPGEDRHLAFNDDRTWFDWYEWHVKYWGTKWNSYSNTISLIDTELEIYFETAWCPPIPIIKKLFKLHPELEFRFIYYEYGCQFGGIITRRGHVEIAEEYLDTFVEEEGF